MDQNQNDAPRAGCEHMCACPPDMAGRELEQIADSRAICSVCGGGVIVEKADGNNVGSESGVRNDGLKLRNAACMAKGASVCMADTPAKAIEDIEKGDTVLCSDGQGRQAQAEVVKVIGGRPAYVEGWTRSWPDEEGTHWWFYGWMRERLSQTPAKIHLAHVRHSNEHVQVICDGKFLSRMDGAQGVFKPADLPELPPRKAL